MDDWHRMAIYTQSRLEELQSASRTARLFGTRHISLVRFVVFMTALLLGMLIWWAR